MVCSVQCSMCCIKCTCSDSGAFAGSGAVRNVHCAVCSVLPAKYNMVQLTVHVSVSVLPVLTTLYKLILMHKGTKSQNCEICVL